MGYLEISELREDSSVLPEVLALTDDQLQFLIDNCSSLIDNYTHTDFYLHSDETKLCSGDGTDILETDKCLAVTSIVDKTYFKRDYNVVDYRLSPDGKYIRGLYDFKDGLDNYAVTGDWGYREIPKDIKDCMILLCNSMYTNLFDSERISNANSPFKSERLANYQYDKGTVADGVDLDTTGNLDVDKKLNKYVQISVGVI